MARSSIPLRQRQKSGQKRHEPTLTERRPQLVLRGLRRRDAWQRQTRLEILHIWIEDVLGQTEGVPHITQHALAAHTRSLTLPERDSG